MLLNGWVKVHEFIFYLIDSVRYGMTDFDTKEKLAVGSYQSAVKAKP